MIRYAPFPTVDHPDHQQTAASAERIECPLCQKTFSGAAAITDDPSYSDEHHCFTVVRRAHCDHCNILFAWRQVSSRLGTQLGQILTKEPAIIRSPKSINAFLNAYPEAAGVLQRAKRVLCALCVLCENPS